MGINDMKSYYQEGLWSRKRIKNLVKMEIITENEYREITGEDFENEESGG